LTASLNDAIGAITTDVTNQLNSVTAGLADSVLDPLLDDVIDPRETRPRLISTLQSLP